MKMSLSRMIQVLMPRSTSRFWLAAFLMAWAVDFLFYAKSLGISFLIWIILTLALLWFIAYQEVRRPALPSYVLAGVLILLAGVPLLRRELFSVGIAVFLALGSLILLVSTYRNGHWVYYRTGDFLVAMAQLIFYALTRPFTLRNANPEKAQPDAPVMRTRHRLLPILRGLLLALPLVGLLSLLLASADLVFADRLFEFLDHFQIERLPEYLLRLGYILALGFGFCGALLHAVLPSREAARPDPSRALLKPILGLTEAGIVLASVNALFLFFVILQFQYLFGGQTSITAAGYTYAEYARRGFGELVGVALLSLLLYLTLGSIAILITPAQRRTFSALTVTLLTLVLVILASALQRLVLYEQAYGFTRLRTYAFIFIIWLAVLLLASIVLQVSGRSHHFGLMLLMVMLGFGLTFGAINLDGFIVRQNVQRALAGAELDSSYLARLSSDAVPALFTIYQQPGIPAAIRDELGIELACRAALIQQDIINPFQSYTVSEARARSILTANAEAWQSYPLEQDGDGPTRVVLGNRTRVCLEGILIME